jgi:hypothetical protein
MTAPVALDPSPESGVESDVTAQRGRVFGGASAVLIDPRISERFLETLSFDAFDISSIRNRCQSCDAVLVV